MDENESTSKQGEDAREIANSGHDGRLFVATGYGSGLRYVLHESRCRPHQPLRTVWRCKDNGPANLLNLWLTNVVNTELQCRVGRSISGESRAIFA